MVDHQRNSIYIREKNATAFGAIAFLPIDNRVSAPLPHLIFKLFNSGVLEAGHFSNSPSAAPQ
jgi:hypothetical protein